MKKEDVSIVTPLSKKERCKGHYKLLWILVAIIILAIVNMLTGSLTLKWCAENLTRFSHDFVYSTTLDDLDVLEVDEREKVVRRMWDVYTHRRTTRLPRFWSEAFHAAYDHLVSDVPGVRDAAFSEIAKMSLQPLYFPNHPFLLGSHSGIPSPFGQGTNHLRDIAVARSRKCRPNGLKHGLWPYMIPEGMCRTSRVEK